MHTQALLVTIPLMKVFFKFGSSYINLFFITLLTLSSLSPTTLSSQVIALPCQSFGDAFVGLDRNNFTSGSTTLLSEGALHNFDLPNGVCKRISQVEVEFTFINVDDSGLPAGCSVFDYFLNFSTGCPLFDPASCNSVFNQVQGFPVSQTVTFTNPPNNFDIGDVFGVDIVPAQNDVNCTDGQSAISSGNIILEYDICVTVTLEDEDIDVDPALGADTDVCPNGTVTLDPGSYADYLWAPGGATTPTIDVGAGSYFVTVTDANGCTAMDDITVSLLPEPTITFDPVTPAVCDGGTTNISVNESYAMYQWSNSTSGQTITVSDGTYTVTVTDADNCTAEATVIVSTVPPPNAGNDNFLPVCNDGTLYDMTAQLGTHDPGGTWQDTDVSGIDVNASPSAVDFTSLGAGTYRYTYVATGTAPCPNDEAVITVTVSQSGYAGISDVFDLCADVGVVDFVALLSNPDTGGSWADLDGSTVDLADPTNVDISGLTPDTYRYQYTIFANGACPEVSSILTIVILDGADAGDPNLATICEGSVVDLTTYVNGQSGGTFDDTDGSGQLTGSMFNTAGLAGQSFDFTYTVGAAGGDCGQGSAIITINVESGVTAGTALQDSLCGGIDLNLFDLLTGEDTGGEWTDLDNSGGLSGSTLMTATISAGTYTYKYVVGDDASCPKDSSIVELTINPEPSISYTTDLVEVCQDQCTDIEFVLSGAATYQLILNVTEVDSFLPVLSEDITITDQTYTITTCQEGSVLDFNNDTLRIPADTTLIISFPVLSGNGCTNTQERDSITLSALSAIVTTIDTTACISDTVLIAGMQFFDGNSIFRDTLAGAACDSIIDINVTFQTGDTMRVNDIICAGDSIQIEGAWYDEDFLYDEVVLSTGGSCDSLLIVDLSLYPVADTLVNPELCDGDSIVIAGFVFNATSSSGQVILDNATVNGCDSIVNIDLSFSDGILDTIDGIFCFDYSTTIGGETFDFDNPAGEIVLAGSACDTTVTIDLRFHPEAISLFDGTLCDGDSIIVNGQVYDQDMTDGVEVIQGGSSRGCDSTVVIALSFYAPSFSTLSETLCSGDSIVVNGVTYNEANPSGTETIIDGSVTGCDSMVTVDLNFLAPAIGQYSPMLCDDQEDTFNGTVYNASNLSGIETLLGAAANGCDSMVQVTVIPLETTFGTDSQGLCPGDSIFLAGAWQFTTGDYVDTLVNAASCDSILTTTVVDQNCGFEVVMTPTDNVCPDDSQGSIDVSITPAIEPSFVVVVTPQNGDDPINLTFDMITDQIQITDLLTGSYLVRLFDRFGAVIYEELVTIGSTSTPIDLTASIVENILCPNTDQGVITVSIVGGTIPYSYNWSDTSIGDSAVASDLAPGQYGFTVTDDNGCTAETVFEVVELTTMMDYEIMFLNSSCEGAADGTIEVVEINGGTAPYQISIDGVDVPMEVIDSLTAGIYDIQIVDDNNCMVSQEVVIEAATDATFAEYTTEYIIEEGDSVTIQGEFLQDSLLFVWSPADATISCIDCAFPTVSPSQTTTYLLTVMTMEGCLQEIEITVTVTEEVIEQAFPNIFTPNSDGSNEEFIFTSVYGETQVNIYIMDRWGNMVYQESSTTGIVTWDGSFNGSIVRPGVYVYKLEHTRPDGRVDVEYRDLTLLR